MRNQRQRRCPESASTAVSRGMCKRQSHQASVYRSSLSRFCRLLASAALVRPALVRRQWLFSVPYHDRTQAHRVLHDLTCRLNSSVPDRTKLLCNRRRSTILLLGCADHQPAAAPTCHTTAITSTCVTLFTHSQHETACFCVLACCLDGPRSECWSVNMSGLIDMSRLCAAWYTTAA